MPKLIPQNEDGLLLEEKAKTSKKTKKPPLYQVLLHNDDYTTMDFVVHILKKHFSKSEVQATEIMLKVHEEGMGSAGVYSYEVAETKVIQVTEEARKNEFPLRCTLEVAGE